MKINKSGSKFTISMINYDFEFQIELLNNIIKNDMQILFEFFVPNPYYGSREDVNENIDFLLDGYLADTITFQLESTKTEIERILNQFVDELILMPTNSDIKGKWLLDCIVNGNINLNAEIVKKIKKSVYEKIFYDVHYFHHNQALERMVYKNHIRIGKEDEYPLVADEKINTIWYSPKNEDELNDMIKNNFNYNCVIKKYESPIHDYDLIMCYYETESEFKMDIFKGNLDNVQIESILTNYKTD